MSPAKELLEAEHPGRENRKGDSAFAGSARRFRQLSFFRTFPGGINSATVFRTRAAFITFFFFPPSFLSAFDWLGSLWGEPSPSDVKNTVETQIRVFWNDTSDGSVVWLRRLRAF